MFFLKKILFKLMEFGLGLRPYFALQTRNPAFVNFRLSEAEAGAVRRALPPGYELRPLRFVASDPEPAYWVSYNLYELKYPRPELAMVRKVRCEINTFVRDAEGRDGVFVFCGSPYVSKEEGRSAMGRACDFAERLVAFIYGCGGLTRLRYELGGGELSAELDEGENRLAVRLPLAAGGGAGGAERLSDDYHRYNDVSFFNGGKTYDLVTVNSAFTLAALEGVAEGDLAGARVEGPFFRRAPDRVYYHRGEIGYLVNALNRPRAGRGAGP